MKQDKKKLIVVGVLALAIVAVGAFQLMPSNQASAPAPSAKKDPAETESDASQATATNSTSGSVAEYAADASGDANDKLAGDPSKADEDPTRKLYSMSLAVRDPFASLTALPVSETAPQPTPPTPAPRVNRGGGWKDPGMGIPPMPLPGDFNPNGGAPNGQLPNMNLTPQAPAYSASGVIRGEKNAAVIADAQGNQQLVYEGQAIDGDARVVSVQKGKVIIRKKDGKTITLSVGGNP